MASPAYTIEVTEPVTGELITASSYDGDAECCKAFLSDIKTKFYPDKCITVIDVESRQLELPLT